MSLKLYHETDDTILRSEYTGDLYRALSTFSYSLWVKFEDDVPTARLAYIFGIEAGITVPELNAYLECGNDGALTAGFVNSATTEREITAAAAFTDGAWHHIVYTCTSGAQKLWVDGTVVASGTVADEETAILVPAIQIKADGGYARTFQDIAFWDATALTESMVIALRDRTNTPGGLGAFSWWPLTTTSGDPITASEEFFVNDTVEDVLNDMDFYLLTSGATAWVNDPAGYVPPTIESETTNMIFVDYDNGLDTNDGLDNTGLDGFAGEWDQDHFYFSGETTPDYVLTPGDTYYITDGLGGNALMVGLRYRTDFPTQIECEVIWQDGGSGTVWGDDAIGIQFISTGPKRTIQAALTAAGAGTGDHTVYLEPGPHVVDLSTGLTAACPSGTNPVVTLKSTPHRTGKIHIVNRKCRPGRSSAGY